MDDIRLLEIDTSGVAYRITFEDNSQNTFNTDTTAASGDSGEFIGVFRNDQPRICRLEADASGDKNRGIDQIEFGRIVPEPHTAVISAFGSNVLLRRRRRVLSFHSC